MHFCEVYRERRQVSGRNCSYCLELPETIIRPIRTTGDGAYDPAEEMAEQAVVGCIYAGMAVRAEWRAGAGAFRTG